MHEVQLVRNIFKTLEEEFPGDIENIRTIYVSAGILSNVQPILMQSAFKAVLEDEPKYQRATLEVEVLTVLIHCEVCNTTSEVKNYTFICPCGEPGRNIVQGQELLIKKVDFVDAG